MTYHKFITAYTCNCDKLVLSNTKHSCDLKLFSVTCKTSSHAIYNDRYFGMDLKLY